MKRTRGRSQKCCTVRATFTATDFYGNWYSRHKTPFAVENRYSEDIVWCYMWNYLLPRIAVPHLHENLLSREFPRHDRSLFLDTCEQMLLVGLCYSRYTQIPSPPSASLEWINSIVVSRRPNQALGLCIHRLMSLFKFYRGSHHWEVVRWNRDSAAAVNELRLMDKKTWVCCETLLPLRTSVWIFKRWLISAILSPGCRTHYKLPVWSVYYLNCLSILFEQTSYEVYVNMGEFAFFMEKSPFPFKSHLSSLSVITSQFSPSCLCEFKTACAFRNYQLLRTRK